MQWNQLFDSNTIPAREDIRTYISETKPIWDQLVLFVEETAKAKRQLDFSKCSAQPGWNVKYKKSSKSLCTLYPMPNYFIALVVVGPKEEAEVEMCMTSGEFSAYVKKLYQKTSSSAMGRWLMIEVTNEEILNDVITLIKIRLTSK